MPLPAPRPAPPVFPRRPAASPPFPAERWCARSSSHSWQASDQAGIKGGQPRFPAPDPRLVLLSLLLALVPPNRRPPGATSQPFLARAPWVCVRGTRLETELGDKKVTYAPLVQVRRASRAGSCLASPRLAPRCSTPLAPRPCLPAPASALSRSLPLRVCVRGGILRALLCWIRVEEKGGLMRRAVLPAAESARGAGGVRRGVRPLCRPRAGHLPPPPSPPSSLPPSLVPSFFGLTYCGWEESGKSAPPFRGRGGVCGRLCKKKQAIDKCAGSMQER